MIERLHCESGESASTQSTELTKEPWTNPDPQPGDFDAELDRARPDNGNHDAKLSITLSVEDNDAKRPE